MTDDDTSRLLSGTKSKHPPISAIERGPGPAKYKLPPTFEDPTRRRYPAYSFGIRLSDIRKRAGGPPGTTDTPGPGTYSADTKEDWLRPKAPSYSFGSRQHLTTHQSSPGPAAYSNERAAVLQPTAPLYTMRARPLANRRPLQPAPNAYSIKPTLGQEAGHLTAPRKPAWSMGVQHSHGNIYSTGQCPSWPGPLNYHVGGDKYFVTRHRPPQYSLTGRHGQFAGQARPSRQPGPAQYDSSTGSPSVLPRAPTFPLGVKHSDYIQPVLTEHDLMDDGVFY